MILTQFALSGNDDKRIIMEDRIHTLAYGHYSLRSLRSLRSLGSNRKSKPQARQVYKNKFGRQSKAKTIGRQSEPVGVKRREGGGCPRIGNLDLFFCKSKNRIGGGSRAKPTAGRRMRGKDWLGLVEDLSNLWDIMVGGRLRGG